jgi:signal transduction histidine kinase
MEIQLVSRRRQAIGRYGPAILGGILALLLRSLLAPLLGNSNPYHTMWLAVVFSAWYCGVGPSVVTTVVGVVGVWYWFLPPTHSFGLLHPKAQISAMIGFLVFAGFIIALGEANRRSKERSERELRERTRTEEELRERERELQAARSGLENRVMERTAELKAANQSLQQLSARLLQVQDEERRRIARELHDSVGQLLAAISMNIAMMQSTPLSPAATVALAENAKLVDQISSEIRTISHLLHPPLLDEVGLASALRWYVEGFSDRSKIAVELAIAGDLGRLDSDMEIAIFRVVQECLTNVHRHSGSSSAEVRLAHDGGRICMEIKDAGNGIPREKQEALRFSGQTGVGFRGMRERIAQLGGVLEIQSDEHGSVVKATLPVQTLSPLTTSEEVVPAAC